MIEKLPIMMQAQSPDHSQGSWTAQPSVSLLDVVNKLNEVIDQFNTLINDE